MSLENELQIDPSEQFLKKHPAPDAPNFEEHSGEVKQAVPLENNQEEKSPEASV